jgi:hypothetical protein
MPRCTVAAKNATETARNTVRAVAAKNATEYRGRYITGTAEDVSTAVPVWITLLEKCRDQSPVNSLAGQYPESMIVAFTLSLVTVTMADGLAGTSTLPLLYELVFAGV